VLNAKLTIKEIDEQHKVDIIDSRWIELFTNGTDNVLWALA